MPEASSETPATGSETEDTWSLLLVEDDDDVRRQVKEHFADKRTAGRTFKIEEIAKLPDALNLIKERKADLVILDVYKGPATPGGEQTGVLILESIKRSGFVPVVLYTALPEGLESYKGAFVRLVGKDSKGLAKLDGEIEDLFRLRIPQLYRAIVDHLDEALRSYMWEFVQEHWAYFGPLVETPDFLRLIVQRLGLSFANRGIDTMAAAVYGIAASSAADPDTVHPAQYYIKPPIGSDPLLGDIRLRISDGDVSHLLVLWPSCDMVSTRGRTPKTDHVLCARASLAREAVEVKDWVRPPTSNTKRKTVTNLVKNVRASTPERYHFLPGAWDIPDLVVDFQALEHLSLATVTGMQCLATLASPFAEALGTRFQRYIGRPGTPDLDVEAVLKGLKE